MAFDLGDVVTLSVTVRDEAGAPANAGAVTATVTAPDGTTSATPVSNPSAGVYTSAYTPAAAGVYGYRFVATGVNACAFFDGFTVVETGVPLLGLADVKAFLNMSSDTTDEELRATISAATALAEKWCGRVLRARTWTGRIVATGTGVLLLPEPSALSVTTVSPVDGQTVPAWTLDATGQMIYPTDPADSFTGSFDVTARLGVSGDVLEIAQQGVRELIRHMWAPQRGSAPTPMQAADGARPPGAAYAFPYVVTEKLEQIRGAF